MKDNSSSCFIRYYYRLYCVSGNNIKNLYASYIHHTTKRKWLVEDLDYRYNFDMEYTCHF